MMITDFQLKLKQLCKIFVKLTFAETVTLYIVCNLVSRKNFEMRVRLFHTHTSFFYISREIILHLIKIIVN